MSKKPDHDNKTTALPLTLEALRQGLKFTTSPTPTLTSALEALAAVAAEQPNEPEKSTEGSNKPKWRARKRRSQGQKQMPQD